ncbi:MAG: glycosyltransferase family 2 protein [Tepidisphaeraceae bacterium]|jgi:putative glycosyltransferase
MDLSIVATMYHSAGFLAEFHRRCAASADKLGVKDLEIVLVNDGSPDDSLNRALELHRQDPRVVVVDLSRNFGHHKAMMTGLKHARGELVFLIDCDLEEPPELLEAFYAEMKRAPADVIFGQQETRRGGFFERFSGACFYWILKVLSNYPLPSNVLTARLMTRRYVRSLVQHRDQEVFILGLWSITGFEQRAIKAEKSSKGRSTYTLARKLALTANAITSFSNKPLIYIAYLGISISVVAIVCAAYLVFRRIFFGDYLEGWPSLIVSIWLLGGLTILCLGVIAIYLSRIFTETKRRPYTIVRQIHRRDPEEAK